MNEAPIPVQVSDSAVTAVTGTLIGAILVMVTGFSTILSFWDTRDIVGAMVWFQGSEGLKFLSAAGLIGTIAWRAITSKRRHDKAREAADAAPNSKAVVVPSSNPIAKLFR